MFGFFYDWVDVVKFVLVALLVIGLLALLVVGIVHAEQSKVEETLSHSRDFSHELESVYIV